MPRILVIRFGALGDLVLSTVVLEALRSVHPDARISFVTKSAWKDLLAADPRIDELVLLEKDQSVRDLGRALADRSFDFVVDAHANLRSRALVWLLPPAPVRRLSKDSLARWILLRGGPELPGLRRRLIDRFLDLVPEAPRSLRPRLHLGRPPEGEKSAHDAAIRRIALAPGARHAPKRWPVERFAELAERIRGNLEAEVLVLGGPDEAREVETVARAAGVEPWDPTRPLDALAHELAASTLLVGNDSGLLHLAEAVGTPVVGIYGPTVRAWGYFPWDPRSQVLEHELPCRPCSKIGDRPCRYAQQDCLTRTTVRDVFALVEKTWNETNAAHAHP